MGLVQGPRGGQLTPSAGWPARRVVVARHGQTDWNLQGRYQGHGDPPLNDLGLRQAEALAGELSPLGITVLASSDLQRARQTAAAVEARTGLVARPCPAFREVDLGTWEGLTEPEVALRHPDELAAWHAGGEVRRGGGETELEAAARFVVGLDRLLDGDGDGVVAVVAHGLVLRRTLGVLVAAGRLVLPGPPPHLANGHWMELALTPQE